MSEFAYDLTQATPAELVSSTNALITDLIERDHDTQISPANLDQWSNSELNAVTTFRTRRINSRPSRWWLRDAQNDAFSYIPDPGGNSGDVYNIDQAFVEMLYSDARKQARRELEVYYQAYSTSQFTAQGDDFSAAPGTTITYLIIDTIIAKAEAAGGYTGGQFVFDMEGEGHPIPTAAGWDGFWNKYENLFDEARAIVSAAWQDVKDVSTTDDVATIMDALPPIPGSQS